MRTRLLVAATAVILTVPVLSATAEASPASPQHKCEKATGVEHKCEETKGG